MPSHGPDDRDDGTRRGRRPGDAPDPADEPGGQRPSGPPPGTSAEPPTAAEEVGERADPDAEPPVHRDDAETRPPADAADVGWSGYRPTTSPGDDWTRPARSGQYGTNAPGDRDPAEPRDRAPQPPSPVARRDRFGWSLPEGMDAEGDAERPDPPAPQSPPAQRSDPPPSAARDDSSPPPQAYNPYDTSSWRASPAPDAPPRGGYSGQFPTQGPAPDQPPRGPYSGQFPVPQPPRQSGAFPIPPDPARSGPFAPIERGPDDRRSGAFPTVPDAVSQSGAYAAPPDPYTYDPSRSGAIPQSSYRSGAMPQVQRSGQFAYPGEVTSTGSRRVIVAPDAGIGSLLADRPALAFLLAAAALAGAMIAFIALRYAHLPDQIALHFGPAGSSQPTRIGEKRELWTIPFIVGIVLAADTALAWALYRFDRFAARLLTLGSALVAAIAWVVLLTVLHR